MPQSKNKPKQKQKSRNKKKHVLKPRRLQLLPPKAKRPQALVPPLSEQVEQPLVPQPVRVLRA